MKSLDHARARVRSRPARIALAGFPPESVQPLLGTLGTELGGEVFSIGPGGVEPERDSRLGKVAEALRAQWPERVRDGIHGLDLAAAPLLFASGLILRGEIDVCLAGPSLGTDAVEDAARWLLGAERRSNGRGHLAYAECVDGRLLTLVLPDSVTRPMSGKAVALLALAGSSHRDRVCGDTPRVALLVAPPSIDAAHADAEMALGELRQLAPGITATVEWTPSSETDPDSARFRTRPNVLIFPDPVTGHLAQFLLREVSGRRVLGPIFSNGQWALAGGSAGSTTDDWVDLAILASAGLSVG